MPHAATIEQLTRLMAIDQNLIAEPYALFRQLHEEAPVLRIEGSIVVADYTLARQVLHSPAQFSSENREGFTRFHSEGVADADRDKFELMIDFEQSLTARMDDPRHSFHRGLVSTQFGLRSITDHRELIRAIVDEQIDAILAEPSVSFDMLEQFAGLVPVSVIMALFGVPVDDRPLLKAWTDSLARWRGSKSALSEAHDAALLFRSYVEENLFPLGRMKPEGIVGALVNASLEPNLVAFRLMGLLLAGAETTTNLLTGGTMYLLQNGGVDWRRLREEPELVPGAVEEMLRVTSPNQFVTRFANEDTEIGSIEVRAGEAVVCLLGAANRDPKQFPDPDHFDITRPNARQHLGFGFGIHRCLGMVLAREEANVAFRRLTETFPSAALTTDSLRWRPNFQLRGLAGLPVLKTAA